MSTWSKEEEHRLMRMWLVPPAQTQREIAEELGKSTSAVSRRIKKMGLRGEKGNVSLYGQITGEEMEPLLQPVRVEMGDRETVRTRPSNYTSVHFSDVQIPFQDPRAVEIMLQIVEDIEPTELYAMGDVLDMWQVSSYRPPDEREFDPDQLDLQSNFEDTSRFLAQVEDAAGSVHRKVFLEGNHEERWSRLLRDIQKNYRTRHLLRLPKLNEALSLPYLLGLDDMDWEYYNYKHEQPICVNDKLVLLHGYKSNKYVARSMLDEFGKSVMYGHDHKIQQWTRTDLNGQIAGFGIGCLCERQQHYSDHGAGYGHQGFAIVDWSKIDGEWYFNVEQVRIHDGRTIFRGREYTA